VEFGCGRKRGLKWNVKKRKRNVGARFLSRARGSLCFSKHKDIVTRVAP
jgi:hypothetical protein